MRRAEARQLVGIAVVAACALAMNVTSTAQAPDPLVGTWKLDVAKSTYKPGPAPKSTTVVISAAEGKALKIAVDADMPDGPMKWSYTNTRDGKETPVTGNPNYDAVKVTQVSPTEGTIQYMKGGKPSLSRQDVRVEGRQDADGDDHRHKCRRAGCPQRRALHEAVAPGRSVSERGPAAHMLQAFFI